MILIESGKKNNIKLKNIVYQCIKKAVNVKVLKENMSKPTV